MSLSLNELIDNWEVQTPPNNFNSCGPLLLTWINFDPRMDK